LVALAIIVLGASACSEDAKAKVKAAVEETTTTTTIPPSTVPGDTVPEGPINNPDDFGTDRPASLVGGILFDQLTAQGVPPNQANCAIETVPGGVDNIDTQAVLDGDDAAAAPVVQAALDCGIDQATVDAVLTAIRGG